MMRITTPTTIQSNNHRNPASPLDERTARPVPKRIEKMRKKKFHASPGMNGSHFLHIPYLTNLPVLAQVTTKFAKVG